MISTPSWPLLAATIILAIPISRAATASPFELYGAGARGTAMAGAQTAAADDAAAVFYNPALLSLPKDARLDIGLQLLAPTLSIERSPNSPGDAQGGHDTLLPETSMGITLGALVPLGARLGDPFALGIVAYAPVLGRTRLEATDPASPHFALHAPQVDRFYLGAALSWEVTPGLSLGVGAQAFVGVDGEASATLNLEERQVLRREFDAEIRGELAPIAGVVWLPAEAWSVGIGFRGEMSLPYRLPIEFALEEGGRIFFEIEGVNQFAPQTWTLGVAWRPERWTVTADLAWERWSKAPTPAATVITGVEGLGSDADPPISLLDMSSIVTPAGFVDVLVPRLGIERGLGPVWTVRGGYGLRPTPVPRQVGYTNFADSTAHHFSLGARVDLGRGPDWLPVPLGFDVFVQAIVLQPRRYNKDPARDPLSIGDVEVGGQIWHFGLAWHRSF